MSECDELKAKVAALRAELADIEAQLAKVPELEKRRSELCDGWNRHGEIRVATLKLRDSAFPVLNPEGSFHRALRIIAVDDKWITTRLDGLDEVTRYNRATGRKERMRSDWNNIDVAAALAIWDAHKASKASEVPA